MKKFTAIATMVILLGLSGNSFAVGEDIQLDTSKCREEFYKSKKEQNDIARVFEKEKKRLDAPVNSKLSNEEKLKQLLKVKEMLEEICRKGY